MTSTWLSSAWTHNSYATPPVCMRAAALGPSVMLSVAIAGASRSLDRPETVLPLDDFHKSRVAGPATVARFVGIVHHDGDSRSCWASPTLRKQDRMAPSALEQQGRPARWSPMFHANVQAHRWSRRGHWLRP
jgi:hypothetical protein